MGGGGWGLIIGILRYLLSSLGVARLEMNENFKKNDHFFAIWTILKNTRQNFINDLLSLLSLICYLSLSFTGAFCV